MRFTLSRSFTEEVRALNSGRTSSRTDRCRRCRHTPLLHGDLQRADFVNARVARDILISNGKAMLTSGSLMSTPMKEC